MNQADLLKKIKALEEENRLLKERVAASRISEAQLLTHLSSPRSRQRPLRAIVLDALEDLGWPATSRQIALYCEAMYGRRIASERFGVLAKDERDAFGKKVRPVWLCFALTAERHEPIKRIWARSDWPLESRIFAPTSGRVQHLKLTIRMAELALNRLAVAADPVMLGNLAADLGRDLPGVVSKAGEVNLEQWRDLAVNILSHLPETDAVTRSQSAMRLRVRPEVYQLFGMPDVITGDVVEPAGVGRNQP